MGTNPPNQDNTNRLSSGNEAESSQQNMTTALTTEDTSSSRGAGSSGRNIAAAAEGTPLVTFCSQRNGIYKINILIIFLRFKILNNTINVLLVLFIELFFLSYFFVACANSYYIYKIEHLKTINFKYLLFRSRIY